LIRERGRESERKRFYWVRLWFKTCCTVRVGLFNALCRNRHIKLCQMIRLTRCVGRTVLIAAYFAVPIGTRINLQTFQV